MIKKLYVLIFAQIFLVNGLWAQKKVKSLDREFTTKATDATIKLDIITVEKVTVCISKIIFKKTIHDFGSKMQNAPTKYL